MDTNLHHEDLLIKLRSKLNQEKIKLWEAPYYQTDKTAVPQDLQDLAVKYSAELSTESGTILEALLELQQHSVDRSKDNAEFQETGVATMRVKATVPGEKPNIFKVHMKLDVAGSELIETVATTLSTAESRVKLIFNGKVIKPNPTIGEQGVKNGTQIMALIMKESPEAVQQEESRYREMRTTRDDATLLSEVVDDIYDGDEEYMKLEDQSGKTVELPAAERKSLMVGLAMHERGRGALKQQDYPLALLLLLEADRLLSDCRSSILKTVDNWAVLQLDISWCYVCLRSLQHAADAATRLAAAEKAFRDTYGASQHRLLAVKGTAANERVLFMRLYLLQGIVAYHQNRRADARSLLERAEVEMNALRVNSADVLTLVELGWSAAAARGGLRAAGGDVARAHQGLQAARDARREARARHQQDRLTRALGICVDGTPVSQQLVDGLIGMGFSRRRAIAALRNSNNHVADAVRLIQEQPDLLDDSDMSSETDSTSDDSLPEADEKLTEELVAMGYVLDQAKYALRLAKNRLNEAVDLLAKGGKLLQDNFDASTSGADGSKKRRSDSTVENDFDASTSGADGSKKRRSDRRERARRRRDREAALKRLTTSIQTEANDHLDTSLTQEEDLLAQYKSLL